MNYLLFSFLKTLYFCYNSMVFLSIYNILYTIGKLWFPSFQWDCCQSEILTYLLSSQLSIQISYLSPVQLVLFKMLEYSRQCKIPHSKAYALLLRTDNQESCSATLGPHLYWYIAIGRVKESDLDDPWWFLCLRDSWRAEDHEVWSVSGDLAI